MGSIHTRSGEGGSIGSTWTSGRGEQSPERGPSSRIGRHLESGNNGLSMQRTQVAGSSRQAADLQWQRMPFGAVDSSPRQRQFSTDTGSAHADRLPSNALQLSPSGRAGAGRAEAANGQFARGASGKQATAAASSAKPATSHFKLQRSLTQSSGQAGAGIAAYYGRQEQDSRPPASSFGAPHLASQPSQVSSLFQKVLNMHLHLRILTGPQRLGQHTGKGVQASRALHFTVHSRGIPPKGSQHPGERGGLFDCHPQ